MLDLYLETILAADWFFVGLVFLGGLVIAHTVGSAFARSLEVQPGHGREVMPSLPVAPTQRGRAAVRFQNSVVRVERLLLREFSGGVQAAEATALAGQLNEDPIVVSAALERMREEIPCRMQITASGKIRHDFAAEDVAALRTRRRAWLPVRLMVFGLAGLANIGAIWPVLLILTLALWTLDVAVSNASETAVHLGGAGLIAILVAFAAAMGVSWAIHFLLTPLISAPRLGEAVVDLSIPRRWSDTKRANPGWRSWFGGSRDRRRRRGTFWWFGGSSSSRSSSSSSGDSDSGGGGAGQAIIIIIAIAIIVLCTIALYVWLRGLWRALSSDERELERMSPSLWVRTAVAVDTFERYIPTNDLVGRVYRALSRAHSRRRPVDEDLGPRVLLLAAHREGRVSTLDIALAEGLDLDEAAEVGSRLSALVGGRILLSDIGDLVFEFPPQVLTEIDATPDEDMWAEYLDPDPIIGRTKRRGLQKPRELPVNLVGLTHSHIVATDRLVGGTLLMAVSGMILLNYPGLLQFQLFAPLTGVLTALSTIATPLTLVLFAFAVGAMCLSASARYTARAVAIHGVRRDARRATFDVIRGALADGMDRVDLTALPDQLVRVFEPAWDDVSETMMQKEVHGVLVDLDLEPALDAGGRLEVDLTALRRRKETAYATAEAVFDETSLDVGDDAVVFETEVSHDRVKVLA